MDCIQVREGWGSCGVPPQGFSEQMQPLDTCALRPLWTSECNMYALPVMHIMSSGR